jgi:DNA-binding PadR family transcriptional regulator
MPRTPRLTKFILERLNGFKEAGAEFSEVFLENPFEAYPRARKKILEHINPNFRPTKNKHRFYSVLNHLYKQGLVEKDKKDNRLRWTITKLGKNKLKDIKDKNNSLPSKINYKTTKEKNLKLIVFDIPEKYRYKRVWLREQLIMLDFVLLQKSVWMGKNKIPEEFIKNINNLGLLPYIHIFTVQNKGTLDFNK